MGILDILRDKKKKDKTDGKIPAVKKRGEQESHAHWVKKKIRKKPEELGKRKAARQGQKINLNVKFNEIDGGIGGGSVEWKNGVFFQGLHSSIRWMQYVHTAPSVTDH